MKSVCVLCFLTFIGFISARPDAYSDLNNDIIQHVLNNQTLFKAYISCVLEKGKCTKEGRELKSHIKEALENQCNKCTEDQLKGIRVVIGHLINNEPTSWNQLVAKYDPEHKYVVKYEKELKTVKT